MSFLFIAIGIFLGIYAFFVDATSRNVWGTLPWNNASSYLSWDFWEASPTDEDVIRALYGSGDGGSVYTTNWSGYTSGSCLNAGMDVVYTGVIPSTLDSNTIYVIASGTYEVTSTIEMNSCSALISSGIVTLSWAMTNNPFIYSEDAHNIILENIGIVSYNTDRTPWDGIQIYNSTNFSINNTSVYNRNNWISLPLSLYWNITRIETYENANGLFFYSSDHVDTESLVTYDNQLAGIAVDNGSEFLTFTDITSYDNTWYWIYIYSWSNNISITSGHIHTNDNWIQLSISNDIALTDITVYENTEYNVSLLDSDDNTFTDIVSSGSAFVWIYLSGSFWNTFSSIYSYNNVMAWAIHLNNSNSNIFENTQTHDSLYWIRLDNSSGNNFTNIESWNNIENNIHISTSNNNTFTNIITNSSENAMWIYMTNSSGNIFIWVQASGNNQEGIYFSGSNYNTLNELVSIGNWNDSIYFHNSSYNTGTDITSNNNAGEWLELQGNSSFNIFDDLTINNNSNWLWLESWNNNQILNSTIHENQIGIYFTGSNNTVISGGSIYSNLVWGVEVVGWENNLFNNLEVYNNTGAWVIFENVSWSTINASYIYENFVDWLSLNNIYFENTRYSKIFSSEIDNWIIDPGLQVYGTSIYNGYSNTISGSTITWSARSISIEDSYNNILNNSETNQWISIKNSTWTHFSLIDTSIIEEIQDDWLFLYTLYDSYTTSNNNIMFINSYTNISFLTGNSISSWAYFPTYFDMLSKWIFPDSIDIHTTWFSIYWWSWDGNIYLPTQITTGSKLAIAWETWAQNLAHIFETIEIVSGNSYLALATWNYWSIDYQLTGWTSGQYLKILKSIDGNTWTNNNAQSWCILDEDKICEFNFTGSFKLFAFWIPTNLSFTWYTIENQVITSGWYYKTGIYIIFTWNYISGATLNGVSYTSWSLISSDWVKIFVLTDSGNNSTGITFTIDMTPPSVTLITPTSWSTLLTWTNVSFLWTWYDSSTISWYTLYVDWPSVFETSTTTTWHTLSSMLINWAYTWYVIATDRAGNTWISSEYPLNISAPFTWTITLTWPDSKQIWNYRYSKYLVNIYIQANELVHYSISWDIIGSPLTGDTSSWLIYSPTLSGADGWKNIYVTITNDNDESVSKNFTVRLDTAVVWPTLNTPASGATVVGNPTLTWSSPYADSAGLSWYEYYVSLTQSFATLIASWSMSYLVTSATITGLNFGDVSIPLYRYVKAIDKLGNQWSSTIQSFVYSGWAQDAIPDTFSFTAITGAELNTTYTSSPITITGMTPWLPVLVSINRWALYISGNFVGTTWYIQNWWTVSVELISSNEYSTTVQSTVSIGSISGTFSVKTLDEDDDIEDDYDENYDDIETELSTTQKLQVIAIFESMRDLYAWDKEKEFFNTFMVVLQERMDDYDDDDLQYHTLLFLHDLIEQYYDGGDFGDDIDDTRWIIDGVYTAPNGKKYTIRYDSTKQRFTSTNFVVAKYFPTLDTLKYIIDINNPVGSQYVNSKPISAWFRNVAIDGTRQTSPYTAPNKKVYYFFKTIDAKYSSYTFSVEKWFSSLDDVKQFIYNNNR